MMGNSEYVVHTAFPQQQLICERATMLHYTYRETSVKFYVQLLRIATGSACRVIWLHLPTDIELCSKTINKNHVNRLAIYRKIVMLTLMQ